MSVQLTMSSASSPVPPPGGPGVYYQVWITRYVVPVVYYQMCITQRCWSPHLVQRPRRCNGPSPSAPVRMRRLVVNHCNRGTDWLSVTAELGTMRPEPLSTLTFWDRTCHGTSGTFANSSLVMTAIARGFSPNPRAQQRPQENGRCVTQRLKEWEKEGGAVQVSAEKAHTHSLPC